MLSTMQTQKAVMSGSYALHASRSGLIALPRTSVRSLRRNFAVQAKEGSGFGGEKGNDEKTVQGVEVADQGQTDSFQKIEAPVRGNEASDGGPPMSDRLGGNDRLFIQEDGAKEKNLLGTEVALSDAMRFKGAAPEIINSRLAMLGFIAALGAELATGQTIFQQFEAAPKAIVATFALFAVATLIPIVRGVPRKDAKEFGGLSAFTSNAELINGRVAIVGFACLFIQEAIMKQPTFPHIF